MSGRSSAETFTRVTRCGAVPARSTVTCLPATPSSDAQSVASVSSAIASRFTPSPVTVAPAAVDATLRGRFSTSGVERPATNRVVNRRAPKPAPVATKLNCCPGTIWNVSGIAVSGSVSATGTALAS
ncbi:MAG TPA: hypothetical protein VH573_16410 [Mycobacteriales bacterium]